MTMIKDGADEEAYTLVKQAIESFKEVRDSLFLYDDKLTLGQIVSEIRMLKKKHDIEVVYIDYL
jgi:replicative DNA helicase